MICLMMTMKAKMTISARNVGSILTSASAILTKTTMRTKNE